MERGQEQLITSVDCNWAAPKEAEEIFAPGTKIDGTSWGFKNTEQQTNFDAFLLVPKSQAKYRWQKGVILRICKYTTH